MAKKTKSQVKAIFANASEKTKKKLASEIRTGKVKVKKKK
jgi:hypothetical protein